MRRVTTIAAVALAAAGAWTVRPGAEVDACAQAGDPVVPKVDCENPGGIPGTGQAAVTTAESCAAARTAFRTAVVRPGGRGLRFAFTRRVRRPVSVDVFQVARGRDVLGQRLVARFTGRQRSFTWSGRAQRGRPAPRDGLLFVRLRIRDARGRTDDRRFAVRRARGRFAVTRDFYRRTSCATLTSFKLERPAFGGTRNRALGISFRLARAGTVAVEVRRSGRVVRRFRATTRRAGVTHRLRLASERLPRGLYEVRLSYTGDQGSLTASLYARRL